MKVRFLLFRYDIEGLGSNSFVPIGTTVVSLLLVALCYLRDVLTTEVVMVVVNYILSPMSAWYVFFVYQPVFEYDCSELFRGFPRPSLMLGSGKLFQFLFIYLVDVVILFGTVFCLIGNLDMFIYVLERVIPLSYFFSALAYFSMVFFHNVGTSIALLLGYILICTFLKDNLPSWINVLLSANTDFPSTLGIACSLGSLFWLISQEKVASLM